MLDFDSASAEARADNIVSNFYRYSLVAQKDGTTNYTFGKNLFGPFSGDTLTFDNVYFTENGTATGKPFIGTWWLRVESWIRRPIFCRHPLQLDTYDPNPPSFQIVDAVGTVRSDGALTSGALTDGVTFKGTVKKAPGTTLTLKYTVSDGVKQGETVTYTSRTEQTRTITVGSDGSWALAIPSGEMGNGLKKIVASVTDYQTSNPPQTQSVEGIYVTSAWTPAGLGLSGLTGWYDASLSYTNKDGVVTWSDISGNGVDGTLLSSTGPTLAGSAGQQTLTFKTELNADRTVKTQTGFLLSRNVAMTSLVYAGDLGTPSTSSTTIGVPSSALTALRSGSKTTAVDGFTSAGFFASSDLRSHGRRRRRGNRLQRSDQGRQRQRADAGRHPELDGGRADEERGRHHLFHRWGRDGQQQCFPGSNIRLHRRVVHGPDRNRDQL